VLGLDWIRHPSVLFRGWCLGGCLEDGAFAMAGVDEITAAEHVVQGGVSLVAFCHALAVCAGVAVVGAKTVAPAVVQGGGVVVVGRVVIVGRDDGWCRWERGCVGGVVGVDVLGMEACTASGELAKALSIGGVEVVL
jgi:hypothetical protein